MWREAPHHDLHGAPRAQDPGQHPERRVLEVVDGREIQREPGEGRKGRYRLAKPLRFVDAEVASQREKKRALPEIGHHWISVALFGRAGRVQIWGLLQTAPAAGFKQGRAWATIRWRIGVNGGIAATNGRTNCR